MKFSNFPQLQYSNAPLTPKWRFFICAYGGWRAGREPGADGAVKVLDGAAASVAVGRPST